MRALICGIGGQDGAYLAQFLLGKGYEVIGTSRDAQASSFTNLERLGLSKSVTAVSMAISDFRSVISVLKQFEPDEIYNLAGQSSVGLSFTQPVETIESIVTGTLNLLEGIRFVGAKARLYSAGSGECFGDTGIMPANEKTPFTPKSPYAVAKAAAHNLVATYREAYGLFACTGILFNHESPLRPRRFVTQKIVHQVALIARGKADRLVLGNVDIARDWGWAPEYVDAMWRMLQQKDATDYVIATGQSYSLRDFVSAAFSCFGLDCSEYIEVDPTLIRPADHKIARADPSKAGHELNWTARYAMPDVVKMMIESLD